MSHVSRVRLAGDTRARCGSQPRAAISVPHLAHRYPELGGTVERLRAEHETIAALVEDLRAVIADGADPLLVRSEVDRLTDELERHLAYEEEQLIPVLDAP